MVGCCKKYTDQVCKCESSGVAGFIRGCRNMDYISRLAWLELPTLKYRRFRGDMLELYKILNNLYDSKTVPVFEMHLDTRTRGNSFKIKVDRCNCDVRKFSFCSRVVKAWNSLPESVVASTSVNAFKRNYHFLCDWCVCNVYMWS